MSVADHIDAESVSGKSVLCVAGNTRECPSYTNSVSSVRLLLLLVEESVITQLQTVRFLRFLQKRERESSDS